MNRFDSHSPRSVAIVSVVASVTPTQKLNTRSNLKIIFVFTANFSAGKKSIDNNSASFNMLQTASNLSVTVVSNSSQ